jgi:general secretion pathway protein N
MKRWALIGGLLGALAALVVYLPAAWVARSVAQATGGQLLLADAKGSLWRGSAVLVLTGGEGARDASALPGRLHWRVGLSAPALALRLRHACCINGELLVRVVPGLNQLRVELQPANSPPANAEAPAPAGSALPALPALPALLLGQWPASLLSGLGTPWNTLQPRGTLQVATRGVTIELIQGRWVFAGRAEIGLTGMSSRVSTLDELGNYQIELQGDPRGQAATVQLSTRSGALQLNGSGQWAASRLRFSGQASAAPGSEAALNNLLNIIGRRQGALSLITIG